MERRKRYRQRNYIYIYIYIYIYKEKGVASSPTPRCSSCWKGSFRVTLDYSHQLYLIYIYVITSCHQHGYPWPFLVTPPYRPSFPAGLQGYIPCQHWAGHYTFARPCEGVLQEYISYELVLTSPAVSHMSGLSKFDSFRDGWKVAVQVLLCWVLPPWLDQYCS